MNKPITVFVSGHFNILHPGHLRLLRSAKEYGDRLIVAVESDSIAGPAAHLPENLRLEGVQSNTLVDEAFIANEPISKVIDRLRPDVIVKGKEHELGYNPELKILKKYGGRLVFSSGEAIFSSFDLIQKEFNSLNSQFIDIPNSYLIRHSTNKIKLKNILDNFSNLKVCVIGDLIVDEYITCEPLGMSQEDPTIVVKPINSTLFIGGAGIVASHAAGLGAKVEFVSISGDDFSRAYALERLASSKVDAHILLDPSRPTTLKKRYRSKGKTLLRVSDLHQESISQELQEEILKALKPILIKADLLVFSDFNYGCLPQSLVDKIIIKAKECNVILAADSQSSSQLGDITRFKGMDLITPTEREARISLRNQEDGLVILAEKLKKQAKAKNIFIKLGEEGILIHSGNSKKDNWLTDKLEALNNSPKDVAGAGDSLLIASAMTIACGASIWEASILGSLAAAIQVGRVGNTPLSVDEIAQELI